MRVAFAVVTAFRPEILIVDEALSVGDSYFSHKCMAKIRDFQDNNTTILLVSHDVGTVKSLCDRAILLVGGAIFKDGRPDEIVDYYNALIAEKENTKLSIDQRRKKNGWLLTASGTLEAKVSSMALIDVASKKNISVARVGQLLQLKVAVEVNSDIHQLVLGLMIRNIHGTEVWGTNTWHTHQQQLDLKKGESLTYFLNFPCNLGAGSYSFSTALCSSDSHLEDNFEWVENSFVFDVINIEKDIFAGVNWIDAKIEVSSPKRAIK